MIRHKLHYLLTFLIVSLSILLNSCNDQPSEVGSEFWLDTITLRSISTNDTSLIVNQTNEVKQFGLFRLGGLLLGKANGVTAITFIRFTNIPDTLNYVKESDIIEATLELTPQKYTFGDTNSNILDFSVYRINNLWFNLTTWDSIVDPSKQPYYGPNLYGNFSGTSTTNDSTALKVTINKGLVATFFDMQSDSLQRIKNYGLALVPNGNTNVIRRFSTKTLLSEDKSKYVILKVVFRNERKNNILDTILLESGVDASIVHDNLVDQNENIVLQGSLMKRTKLTFDLSMIPTSAFIHFAQLSFERDETKSLGSTTGIDEIIALAYYSSPESASITSDRLFLSRRKEGTNTYTFNSIISLVEQWLRYSKGKGVAYLEPEGTSKLLEIDKVSFYGVSNPDSTKRPSLKVIYSTRPGFGRK